MRVAVLLLATLAALGAGPGSARAETTIGASVWEAAGGMATPPARVPELTLPDVSGKSRRLGEFKGRVVMLYFWATW